VLYTVGSVSFVLLLLLFFTYAYHLALAIAVTTFLLLSFLLAKPSSQNVIVSTFELNSQGGCSFDGNIHYQLQASSRFSFLGCWLTLQPLIAQPMTAVNASNSNQKKLFFIYRDSLSSEDFSRISNVISQLNH
jgi:hypothetical protein